jgi:putative oxidoreductase
MFPQTHPLIDLSLLLLRIVVALVFVNSGWNMLNDPGSHAKDLGLSRPFTLVLGTAEFVGGVALAFGILMQIVAAGFILINLGAIYKKIAVWHSGFWGEARAGWSYDLLFVVMEFVVLATGGGRYAVLG